MTALDQPGISSGPGVKARGFPEALERPISPKARGPGVLRITLKLGAQRAAVVSPAAPPSSTSTPCLGGFLRPPELAQLPFRAGHGAEAAGPLCLCRDSSEVGPHAPRGAQEQPAG